jgi:hypothetical protein
VISGDAPRREEYKEMISEGRGNACLEIGDEIPVEKIGCSAREQTNKKKQNRGAKRLTEFPTARRLRFPQA